MIDKTEAQPEALRLADALAQADRAEAAAINYGEGTTLGIEAYASAKTIRAQHAEIQQLKAREHELEQMHDHSNLVVDAAKEHIASLATELRETNEMNQQLRDQNTAVDTACAALEKTGIEAANRAATAEQQVTALTQRLDMANRLNTDARNQLTQIKEKNAWLEDEMRSQCNIHGIAAEREATRMTQNQRMHERIAELEAQLSARQAAPNPWQQAIDHELVCLHLGVAEDATKESAAKALRELIQCHVEIAINPQTNGGLMLQPHGTPPQPEREPLTDEQIFAIAKDVFGGKAHELIHETSPDYAKDCDMEPGARWTCSEVRPEQTLALSRALERAHGIGATND